MVLTMLSLLYACNKTSNHDNQILGQSNDCMPLPYTEECRQRVCDSIGADSKKESLRAIADSLHAFKKLNGCILIRQAGIDLLQYCKGSTCLTCKDKQENCPETLFQLASMSKTFTAVAVLQLIEKKVLSLQDSIEKFYPNFPYKRITIQSLLSHRSGLPNYMYAFEDSARKTSFPDNQTIVKWFENEKPAPYGTANKAFSYNNSNYAVLAAIIEKVTGLSYADYMHQYIFAPLQMSHTYISGHIPDSLKATIGHEGRSAMRKDFFDEVMGDKGIYSCIEDLSKWHHALQGSCLVSQETMKIAFSPQSFEHRGVRNYGLGFRMLLDKDQKTTRYIYHNGWWKGYNTLFWFCPKTKSLIIVLSNVKNKGIYSIKPFIKVLEPQSADKQEDDLEEGN